jgi:hypothetical protein
MDSLSCKIADYPPALVGHAFALQDALLSSGVDISLVTALQVTSVSRRIAAIGVRTQRLKTRLTLEALAPRHRAQLVSEVQDLAKEKRSLLSMLSTSRP